MSKNRIIPVLQRGGFNAMIALRGAINHEMCIGEEVSLSPHYPPNLLAPPPKNWKCCLLFLLSAALFFGNVSIIIFCVFNFGDLIHLLDKSIQRRINFVLIDYWILQFWLEGPV